MLFCLVTGKISHSNTMFWVLGSFLYAFTAKIISHLGLNIKTRVFYKNKYKYIKQKYTIIFLRKKIDIIKLKNNLKILSQIRNNISFNIPY